MRTFREYGYARLSKHAMRTDFHRSLFRWRYRAGALEIAARDILMRDVNALTLFHAQ